ncbi:Nse1 non-SMC component of SMC5-6 complex-domain-containing protein [Lentinula raphanica]|nr:Nse1 non-SMC component of SMC5-6 complex-domain-containing protein [Lentinula raphanica]KAJ3778148.1 Nse1 non-SMC component of SMC5-6 complex-domain-containing protein [Lentinula raphanica]
MVQSADVQKLFLQAIFSRGILSENLAKVLWKKSIEAVKAADQDLEIAYSNDPERWDNFVADVNVSLNDLDFEFKSIQDELNGKKLFALVNRKDDELAQLATDYSAVEIAFFKAVVEQIMLARNESYSVSSLAALREVSAGKEKINLTKSQAEVLLGSFVASGWLLRSKRGRYSLGPRSLLELSPYLKSTYAEEIIECTICHETMTKGIACKRDNCKTRMHYFCFETYRRRHSTCPACSLNWPQNATDDGLLSVGELAVRHGATEDRQTRGSPDSEDDQDMEHEPSQTQTKSRQPRRSQSTKKQNNAREGEEDEEDINEEEEEEAEYTPPPAQRKSRR